MQQSLEDQSSTDLPDTSNGDNIHSYVRICHLVKQENSTDGQSKSGCEPVVCVRCHHLGNINHTDGRHGAHAGSSPSPYLAEKRNQDGHLTIGCQCNEELRSRKTKMVSEINNNHILGIQHPYSREILLKQKIKRLFQLDYWLYTDGFKTKR